MRMKILDVKLPHNCTSRLIKKKLQKPTFNTVSQMHCSSTRTHYNHLKLVLIIKFKLFNTVYYGLQHKL